MKYGKWLLLLAAIAGVGAAVTLAWWLPRRHLVPLVSATDEGPAPALPAQSIVLQAGDARLIEAPFERRTSRPGEGGTGFVALPDRGGANNEKGRVLLSFSVTNAGPHFAWVRARWDDSCGNSLAIKVDAGPFSTVGQDAVYAAWHWVRVGRYDLEPGPHEVTLAGREDGAAVDKILLVPDPAFEPRGSLSGKATVPEVRRVGDDFNRSPGHGLSPWEVRSGSWEIAFSLDPNRIPDQYSLIGRAGATGQTAVAVLQGSPWSGVRVSFSFQPLEPCEAGVIEQWNGAGLSASGIVFCVDSNAAVLQADGRAVEMRLNQWHRVVVERWGWVLRVSVDDTPVLTRLDLAPGAGMPAFCVQRGRVAFDDVLVEEIPWQADDGRAVTIPWVVSPRARWFRRTSPPDGGLAGKRGEILASLNGLPVHAVMLEEAGAPTCRVKGGELVEGFRESVGNGTRRFFSVRAGGTNDTAAGFEAGPKPCTLCRVAVAYGESTGGTYLEGPYRFDAQMIEDPGDYLDFTPEEMKATTDPAQIDRLRRRMKTYPVVGRGDMSPWIVERGLWKVGNDALGGTGPATVRHWRDIFGSQELACRLRLADTGTVAEVELRGGAESGVCIRFAPEGAPSSVPAGGLAARVPADGQWHEIAVSLDREAVRVSVDGRGQTAAMARIGAGGRARLKVISGSALFDDVQFRVPRSGAGEYMYAFDRHETDWWREGGQWIDHGGIACTLASHWISLEALDGQGMLWNKRRFGSDLLVALTVEENTEWLGWAQQPSHKHYPQDNICVSLSSKADRDSGYRVEFNARQRTAVLYRGGVEVAAADRGLTRSRHAGGGGPPWFRRNGFLVVKEGGLVRALVNGTEVLRFQDAEPPAVSRVGIGGYETRLNFSWVGICEM